LFANNCNSGLGAFGGLKFLEVNAFTDILARAFVSGKPGTYSLAQRKTHALKHCITAVVKHSLILSTPELPHFLNIPQTGGLFGEHSPVHGKKKGSLQCAARKNPLLRALFRKANAFFCQIRAHKC
jgi:hypothetical protein